jgi:hypothetical protein
MVGLATVLFLIILRTVYHTLTGLHALVPKGANCHPPPDVSFHTFFGGCLGYSGRACPLFKSAESDPNQPLLTDIIARLGKLCQPSRPASLPRAT